MKPQYKTLVWIGGALFVLGTLALSGCAIPRIGSKPIPSAATILQDAVMVQKTQVKDVEFSMNMSMTGSGTTLTDDIKGTSTASPKRELVTSNLTTAGVQLSDIVIIDAATSTIYSKFSSSSLPGIPSGKWIKMSLGSSLDPLSIDPSQFSNLSQFKGATMKGAETLDGVPVWHLQSTTTMDGLTDRADIYIRQANNQLYEMVAQVTGSLTGTPTATTTGSTTGTVTFKVTGENTGATIKLPPASEVISQSQLGL